MFSYSPDDRHSTMWKWAFKHNIFSDEEIDNIIAAAKKIPTEKGKIGESLKTNKLRKSDIKWLMPNQPDNIWIFNRIANEIDYLNKEFYNFDLYGFSEIQYTTYKPGNYYDWHVDTFMGPKNKPDPIRKLSATIALNDNYEGGQFQFYNGEYPPDIPEIKKGSIIVFPSTSWHRITPVTKDTRISLVAWLTGPLFK